MLDRRRCDCLTGKSSSGMPGRFHRADDLAFRQLEERLSRAGLKETTLDYVSDFVERRGIAEQFGVRSEIEVGAEKGVLRPGVDIDRPAPLVPAITRYDRSVEAVAREKAMPTFDRAWEVVGSLIKLTFADADAFTLRLRSAILDQNADDKVLEKAIADQPERFGDLLGKAGLFGDSKERKEARSNSKFVASHVGSAVVTWRRRLGEEISAEQWQREKREKRDVIEVPGLTSRSAETLAEVDRVPVAERNGWIETLRSTPEGTQALTEAKVVGDALRQRFGHSDPRKFSVELERDASLGSQAELIKQVARTVERVRMAELSRDHAIKQELARNKGLGLQR
ncbi:BID domain-containing protein [Rhizobium sp. 2YAF20]|uniref:BID domain-containing protein n=1 Tax=Rhizobium sp. 2YAF20 TaxID=3233027 RepID=UPI003F9E6E78